VKVVHTAIWVSDIQQTKWFYEDILGLEQTTHFTSSDGVGNYYVGSSDGAEIQFKYYPDKKADVDPKGIDHIAFETDDVDTEFERIVEESECPIVREPTTVEVAESRVAFINDPDGYTVELVQSLD